MIKLLKDKRGQVNKPYYCGDGCCLFNDWRDASFAAGDLLDENMQCIEWDIDDLVLGEDYEQNH